MKKVNLFIISFTLTSCLGAVYGNDEVVIIEDTLKSAGTAYSGGKVNYVSPFFFEAITDDITI
jgi:hypothetical protein